MAPKLNLRKRLHAKELTVGSWITLGHPGIAEIMAKAGLDWVVVDLEHSVIDIAMAGELIRTIDLCGVAPLVRLTSNDANQIKRVMDAGAHGIVVPMVNTPEDAMRAVAATRYPPAGTRGVGLGRAHGYGDSFQEYLRWQEDGPAVVVQIEHESAIERLAEILTVPGVDAFIIGPYDLSCSMGMPGDFANPAFLAAMDRILAAGRKVGCAQGLHIVEPDLRRLEEAIREGYTFIAYSVDIRILDGAVRLGVSKAKGAVR